MALAPRQFNYRFGEMTRTRQHLVNHGSQRRVNHVGGKRPRNARLTPKLKRNRTPFRHDLRNDRAT